MVRPIPKIIHAMWNLKQRLISWFGGKTVGARALIIRDNEVLLVKHTYFEGWCTVGGAIDTHETANESLARELMEEVGIQIEGQPQLWGAYHSRYHKRDDFIIFYIVKSFRQKEGECYCPEIAEAKWFDLNALPEDLTPGTMRRLEEYLGKRPVSDQW